MNLLNLLYFQMIYEKVGQIYLKVIENITNYTRMLVLLLTQKKYGKLKKKYEKIICLKLVFFIHITDILQFFPALILICTPTKIYGI